ncbi:MAG: glycosyltransferase family 9 protein [Opitutaceae bacterium]|nr:glycosyltransferase family 9 protein [Opitutaceae bacterium]
MDEASPEMVSGKALRILIIRRRYLGDIVLLGTTVANLHRHWPDATISLLVDPAYQEVPPLIPHVSRTVAMPGTATAWPGFLLGIRRQRFTHVFDFDNTERSVAAVAATGAPFRTTYAREDRTTRFPWIYTLLAPLSKKACESQPAIDTYHLLLQSSGIPTPLNELQLLTGEGARNRARRLISGSSRKVLIHPGTRSRFRLWPTARFAALIDRIQDELGVQVFLVGGPTDLTTVRKIRDQANSHVIVLEQAFSVEEFAALVAQCHLFVCHDSGPMHIAAAAGTRVVALFGSQNAAIWRPHGAGHVSLQTELPCTCFPAAQLPSTCVPHDAYRSYCVRKLTVDQVFDAVKSQLDATSVA